MNREARAKAYAEAKAYVVRHHAAHGYPDTEALRAVCFDAVQAAFPKLDLTARWLNMAIAEAARDAARRSPEEWAEIFPRYPVDSDGFAESFEVENPDGYREALRRHGCVVIRLFEPERCEATIKAMFEEINAAGAAAGVPQAIDPNDPSTWSTENWPSSTKFLIDDPALHAQAFHNRLDPRVHTLFTHLWGDERLQTSIDNWGVQRGTLAPGASPRWGAGLKPHWDYNPWLFVDELSRGRMHGWQGLLALVDQSLEMGCHLTLPGGEADLHRWCRETPYPEKLGLKRRSHRPTQDDAVRDWMQPLPLRQGHLLLWSWGQLHGCLDNHTDQLRLQQFIRMYPAPEVDPFYAEHDRYAAERVRRRTPEAQRSGGLELSARERRLLGLESWL
ncbi:MAG: phytanoyl-CoA dioxygenase family protein [Bradymonadia bacterium]